MGWKSGSEQALAIRCWNAVSRRSSVHCQMIWTQLCHSSTLLPCNSVSGGCTAAGSLKSGTTTIDARQGVQEEGNSSRDLENSSWLGG